MRNRLVILSSTVIKNMNILCGPSVLLLSAQHALPIPLFSFLAASEDLRAPVDRPLTAKSNKTDRPHKIFMFLISVDESTVLSPSVLAGRDRRGTSDTRSGTGSVENFPHLACTLCTNHVRVDHIRDSCIVCMRGGENSRGNPSPIWYHCVEPVS